VGVYKQVFFYVLHARLNHFAKVIMKSVNYRVAFVTKFQIYTVV
jgi:hypothetical protein